MRDHLVAAGSKGNESGLGEKFYTQHRSSYKLVIVCGFLPWNKKPPIS